MSECGICLQSINDLTCLPVCPYVNGSCIQQTNERIWSVHALCREILTCPNCNLVTHENCFRRWIQIKSNNFSHPISLCCLACQTIYPNISWKKLQDDFLRLDNSDVTNDDNKHKHAVDNTRSISSCPGCNILIEKISGCDEMECSYCGTEFDWRSRDIYIQRFWSAEMRKKRVPKKNWDLICSISFAVCIFFLLVVVVKTSPTDFSPKPPLHPLPKLLRVIKCIVNYIF